MGSEGTLAADASRSATGGDRARGGDGSRGAYNPKGQSMLNALSHESEVIGEPVGIAVVGLGYWGPNLLRVLSDNADVEVRWICDLDSDRLAKYRRRYPS